MLSVTGCKPNCTVGKLHGEYWRYITVETWSPFVLQPRQIRKNRDRWNLHWNQYADVHCPCNCKSRLMWQLPKSRQIWALACRLWQWAKEKERRATTFADNKDEGKEKIKMTSFVWGEGEGRPQILVSAECTQRRKKITKNSTELAWIKNLFFFLRRT